MRLNKFILVLLAVCVFLGASIESQAHNRAGLEKVVMTADTPTENDVAFYFEAVVAEREDEKGAKGRYFLWSFDSFETEGNKSHIHVTITDQKTNKKTNETFHMVRNSDKSWNYVDADGKLIEANIYTMVEPSTFTTIHQIGAAGVAVLVLSILFVYIRNSRKNKENTAE